MKHVVMFSGGVGSWAAAKRVAVSFPVASISLVFADTKIEDEDLYRFLDQAAVNVGARLEWLSEGRDPWEVFFDVRYLGNSRVDPCSRILKRQFLRKYIEAEYDPTDTVVYLGIDWTEAHRLEKARGFWEPWTVQAPLCDPPYLSKPQLLDWLRSEGIEPPRLYALGFPHNNCGGFCIKAGISHFKRLLEAFPDRYAYHEEMERRLQVHLGKPRTILRRRGGGVTRPYSLRELREDVEAGRELPVSDWGGCGCFTT